MSKHRISDKDRQAARCLRAWRLSRGWTRPHLARAIGVSPKTETIKSWERPIQKPTRERRAALEVLVRFRWDDPPDPDIDWKARQAVVEALEEAKGVRTDAAKVLRCSRQSLTVRMKALGIHFPSPHDRSNPKGISYAKKSKKWRAQIVRDGHTTNLGEFATPEEAQEVYWAAKADYEAEKAARPVHKAPDLVSGQEYAYLGHSKALRGRTLTFIGMSGGKAKLWDDWEGKHRRVDPGTLHEVALFYIGPAKGGAHLRGRRLTPTGKPGEFRDLTLDSIHKVRADYLEVVTHEDEDEMLGWRVVGGTYLLNGEPVVLLGAAPQELVEDPVPSPVIVQRPFLEPPPSHRDDRIFLPTKHRPFIASLPDLVVDYEKPEQPKPKPKLDPKLLVTVELREEPAIPMDPDERILWSYEQMKGVVSDAPSGPRRQALLLSLSILEKEVERIRRRRAADAILVTFGIGRKYPQETRLAALDVLQANATLPAHTRSALEKIIREEGA